MTPIFLISTPRSGGTALSLMLDSTPGIRFAGESGDFLSKLRAMESWPDSVAVDAGFPRHQGIGRGWTVPHGELLRAWIGADGSERFFGLRVTPFGHGEWEEAVEEWSWLLSRWPEARIILLRRADDDAAEISLDMTWPLWVPSYATCVGSALKAFRRQRESMEQFADMNPGRVLLLDRQEVFDFVRLNERLSVLGIEVPMQVWMAEAQARHGDRRLIGKAMDLLEMLAPHPDSAFESAEGMDVPLGNEIFAKMPAEIIAGLKEEVGKIERDEEESPEEVRRKDFRLPIPEGPFLKSVQVHTLRFGTAAWLSECAPTLQDWCDRHGYPLKVWGDPGPKYPSAKFVEVEMVREFLAGEAEWMIYVDADVFVHPSAPALPEFAPGFHICPDPPFEHVSGRWLPWVAKHFSARPQGWIYRNAGLWICDREAARLFLSEAKEPFIEGHQEQHQFNYWLWRASSKGMSVHDLGREWNRFVGDGEPAWFFHLAGRKKERKLAQLRTQNLLPKKAEPFVRTDSSGPRAVAYLWSSRNAAGDELLYSMRSVHRFLEDCPPIHLFCDEVPGWLDPAAEGVICHKAPSYEEAIAGAVQCADEVLLMNDDIYLLRPREWEDFRVPLTRKGNLRRRIGNDVICRRRYRRNVARVALWFHHHGHEEIADFSTHTPYLFRRELAVEVMKKFGCFWKMPFETAYFNLAGGEFRRCGSLKATALPGGADAVYFNHGADGPDAVSQWELEKLLPHAAPWEKPDTTPARVAVVWLAMNGAIPHFDEFRAINPNVPVFFDDLDVRKHGPAMVRLGWRNADRRLLAWWEENREKVAATHIVFCEADVRFAAKVGAVFPSLEDFMVPAVQDAGSSWDWWAEVPKLPEEFRQHARGISPLACILASRRMLDAMLSHPGREDLMGKDIFGELRFPTLAAACGFEPGICPGLWNVKHRDCKDLAEGVSHPVKVP